MRSLRIALVSALAGLSVVLGPAQAAPPEMTPYVEGPDQEPTGKPAASVVAMRDSQFYFRDKDVRLTRTAKVRVPRAKDRKPWDRIFLTFTDRPSADEPWDRVFSVAVDGVELIRGTTPRADMTLRKDITEYAPVLAQGRVVDVTVHVGTYVGSHGVDVSFDFYRGEPQVHAPARTVLPAFTTFGVEPEHEDPTRHSAVGRVRFGKKPPAKAVLELTTSGHLQGGEFWYLPDRGSTTPPVFHLLLDGKEVATAHGLPYLYALAGFEGMNDSAHPVMWWTAQREADRAGVHSGTGEIAPYRAELPADTLALLTGSRKVELRVEGKGLWISSVSFLLS
jgi:hypothetical protein